MFKSIAEFFHKFRKSEKEESKSTAKERLHLVLAQDRANISADFLEMMKQEILEVIKKYIDIDEKAIDVRLTNKEGEDGKLGAPALYANIPIITIKNEARKLEGTVSKEKDNSTKEEYKEKKKETNDSSKEDLSKENVEQEGIKVEQEEHDKINENLEEKVEAKQIKEVSTDIDEKQKDSEVVTNQENDNDKNLEEVENEKKNS